MINIQSFSSFAASFFTQNIQSSLAPQKKKILLIVSLAFACLAALYVLRHRCFKGTVQNRKEEGLGIEVKEEKQNDRRKIVYPDGIIEEGVFIEGQLTGQGTRTYPDREIEDGEFKFGRLNGLGKRTTPQGVTEEGNFISGKLHGQGKKTLSDGGVLEGTFENGQLTGQGTRTYPDGVTEKGEFKLGVLNGGGTRTFPEGKTKFETGNFIYGKLQGQGKRTLSNGNVLEGIFENGLFNDCLFDSKIRDLILEYLGENDERKRKSLRKSILSRRKKLGLGLDKTNFWHRGTLDLSHLDLSNMSLKRLHQKGSIFKNTNLSNSVLEHCELSRCRFLNCNFKKVTFINCNFIGEETSFLMSDMKDAEIKPPCRIEKGNTWGLITDWEEFKLELKSRGALNVDTITLG